MLTITTFRNPLADPVGTRRGPPLVRRPQFENRWVSLSQSIHTYTAHIDEQSTLAVNTCHLNGPSTPVAWTGARESGPWSWLSETAVLTVREHGYTARWHECSVHITRVCGPSTRLPFGHRYIMDGPGFKSQSRRYRVTVLGKLFTSVVTLFTKQQNW